MQGISQKTRAVIRHMFPRNQQEKVEQFLVAECGNNLPFLENADEIELEWVRLAVLKLSQGSLDMLLEHIQGAQMDWRDVLVAAGFGYDIHEHTRWADTYIIVP